MIASFGPVGHVANLGHGILPDMKPDHARAFIDAVKEWEWTEERVAAHQASAPFRQLAEVP
jgi:uroporphyrinogen decarboxylase